MRLEPSPGILHPVEHQPWVAHLPQRVPHQDEVVLVVLDEEDAQGAGAASELMQGSSGGAWLSAASAHRGPG